MNQESLIKERKEILDSIKSAFNKLTNISKSQSNKFKDRMAVLEEFNQRYLDLTENPTAAIICKMGEEDEDIKEYVEKACKIIKVLNKAIKTRISPTSGEKLPLPIKENNYSQYGNKIIKGYIINIHQLN